MDLVGAVAVITGAASGIGLALTEECLRRGAAVAMLDIEDEALANEAARLRSFGSVLPIPCDVAEESAWALASAAVEEQLGAVDLLIANAGVGPVGPRLWELTAADWEWTLGVNLWGVVHGIGRFVPGMIERDRGHVVLVSSAAGLLCPPSLGPYVATKHAVTAIGESLLHELADAGSSVGVTVVWPGVVATRMADNERNRPAALMNSIDIHTERSSNFAEARDAMRAAVAGGRNPADLAAEILDAVDSETFGVIGAEWIAESFAARAEAVVADLRPPAPG